MELRRATAEDIPQLVEIRMAYLESDYGTLPEKTESALRERIPEYLARELGKGTIAYIALDSGVIVSSVFVTVCEKPANPHFPTGKIGTVLNVFTKEEYRRQGLAGSLIKMAISDGRAMKLSYLELDASEMGAPLYRSLGFADKKSDYIPMRYFFTGDYS